MSHSLSLLVTILGLLSGNHSKFYLANPRMLSQHDDITFSFVPEVTLHFGPMPGSLSPPPISLGSWQPKSGTCDFSQKETDG